jgi:hypothetical protein
MLLAEGDPRAAKSNARRSAPEEHAASWHSDNAREQPKISVGLHALAG